MQPPTDEFDADAIERRITAPSMSSPTMPAPAAGQSRAFNSTRFCFRSGVRNGEVAQITSGDGETLLTYRGFASVVPIVAALVAGIVMVAGIAATVFLIAEERPGWGLLCALLAIGFSGFIAMLVPQTAVTLYNDDQPALVVAQHSRVAFPRVVYAVNTPDGATIARLRRNIFSRLGRNTWSIDVPADQRGSAFASEESFSRAIVRKFVGKFNRKHEANMRIYHNGVASGVIVRRPDQTGDADYLDMADSATLDRRVAVALATLVFGLEP